MIIPKRVSLIPTYSSKDREINKLARQIAGAYRLRRVDQNAILRKTLVPRFYLGLPLLLDVAENKEAIQTLFSNEPKRDCRLPQVKYETSIIRHGEIDFHCSTKATLLINNNGRLMILGFENFLKKIENIENERHNDALLRGHRDFGYLKKSSNSPMPSN